MYENNSNSNTPNNDEKATLGTLEKKSSAEESKSGEQEPIKADPDPPQKEDGTGNTNDSTNNDNNKQIKSEAQNSSHDQEAMDESAEGEDNAAGDAMEIDDEHKSDSQPKVKQEEDDVEMSETKDSESNHKNSSDSTNQTDESKKNEESPSKQFTEESNTKDESNNSLKQEDDKNKTGNGSSNAPAAPLPVMRGTLFYENKEKGRRHMIRGMWHYENSNQESQRFELSRTLTPDEELEKLPTDGEFAGSFSLKYIVTTSKGKQKERSKVVNETGVKIKFTKMEDEGNGYKMTGTGINQFGVFHINGTAVPSEHDDDNVMNIEFRKSYEPAPPAANAGVGSPGGKKAPKTKDGPLPDPSESYATGVYCLRGEMRRITSADLGSTEVIHRVRGSWAAGLDLILADPEGATDKVSKFEYEHKSMVPTSDFPVSGKYSGWFNLQNPDGSVTPVNERDVLLKFKKNNAGYFNVEGKGSNVFGKYTISGTLDKENTLTIFRHFLPRKIKSSKSTATSLPPPLNAPQARRTSSVAIEELQIKLEDVKAPDESEKDLAPIQTPETNAYAAVSQGILRVDKDGSHSCSGKWAVTRQHLTNDSLTSPFHVRLDALHVQEAAAKDPSAPAFPVDSALYKGSFQMKQGGSRVSSKKIVDQQVVMKFRKNSEGFYNVYGKGVNAIGTFNLVGTLITSSKSGGQMELYRTYPSDLLNPAPASAPDSVTSGDGRSKSLPGPPVPGPGGLQRRESTRTVKLPSKLEDDDPSSQLARAMDKCSQVLRLMKENDATNGRFFAEPVDPVLLGIPTYFQVIKEPMDLKTLTKLMDSRQVDSPEEFARLMRLIFENAVTFNIDPAHSVHRSARILLALFNKKYRDIDRMVQQVRKAQGDDKGKKKKGKKVPEKPKTPREIRLEEAQTMATENARALSAVMAAASSGSPNVTRNEFSLLLRAIEQMQHQMVQTHSLLASLFPGDDSALPGINTSANIAPLAMDVIPASAPAERKKPAPKRKSEALRTEPVLIPDDSTPLTIEEQTLLTETINELDQEHLGGVIQIIREGLPGGADEEEIDLEIDQLDIKTQRKLLRHVTQVSPRARSALFSGIQNNDASPKHCLSTRRSHQRPKSKKQVLNRSERVRLLQSRRLLLLQSQLPLQNPSPLLTFLISERMMTATQILMTKRTPL